MKLCTTAVITGLDNKPHFAVVELSGWPLALFGHTTGAQAKKNEQAAKFFADAPVMFDMLDALTKEFANINPAFPLAAGKMAELQSLVERAHRLVVKHAEA